MSNEKIEYLNLDLLHPFENNPFQSIDESEYDELRDSITEFGIITPLIVNKSDNGYEYLETTDENGEVIKEWAELTDYVSGIKKIIEESKLTVNDLNGNFIYSVENVSKDEESEDSFDGTVTTIGSDVYTLVTEENKDTFKTNGTTDFTKEYTYVNDELNKTQTAGITTSYGYNAENFISILENTLNDVSQVYGYAYDKNGNITTETLTTTSKDENGATVEINEAIHYTYDDKEQLIVAETSSIKYEYTYDDRGNILTKKEYSISLDENNQKVYTLIEANTDTYAYDETWKDKLISYNGQSITYDEVGNPTNYMGNELTWTMGRELASFGNISYTYNEDGIRTSKTVNNVTTTYYLDGTNIIEQNDGTNTLHFYYDSNDEVIGFTYNEADYFYVKNAMSDIVGIVDDSGNLIVSYAYDAWGKVLSVTGSNVELGNLNPFRYRSYYYDIETEFYYLQSRYYDPEVCRFINSDDVNFIGATGIVGSYNAFAYCENNPITNADELGYGPWVKWLTIWDYYRIHTEVQKSIIKSFSKGIFLMEVYVSGSKGKGRLDIYDVTRNEYYEVKSIGSAYTTSTVNQMLKYDNARLLTKKKNVKRGSLTFDGSFHYGAWKVHYYSVKKGLIAYTVTWNQSRYKKAINVGLSAIALIAVAGVTIYVTGGVAAPAIASVARAGFKVALSFV